MSKVTINQSNANRLVIGRGFDKVTRVRVIVGQDDDGNDLVYESGSGNVVFEVTNPMGSQAIADMILSQLSLREFRYRAFEATAIVDPAAEIGDTVQVGDSNSVIYSLGTDHSPLMIHDVSAPYEEEINHEYKFETKQERQYNRQFKEVKATLSIQSDRIDAKVEQTGGDNASFGWSLKATEFGLYSGSKKVFYVNDSGAHIEGEITATSGVIGGAVIEDGTLKIASANISEINASKITAGYLNVDRIEGNSLPGDKIANTSIPSSKYGIGSVTGGVNGSGYATGAIAPSTVAYGNAVFTGTLDQVGINTSNIAALQRGTFGALACTSLVIGSWQIVIESGGRVYAVSAN